MFSILNREISYKVYENEIIFKRYPNDNYSQSKDTKNKTSLNNKSAKKHLITSHTTYRYLSFPCESSRTTIKETRTKSVAATAPKATQTNPNDQPTRNCAVINIQGRKINISCGKRFENAYENYFAIVGKKILNLKH